MFTSAFICSHVRSCSEMMCIQRTVMYHGDQFNITGPSVGLGAWSEETPGCQPPLAAAHCRTRRNRQTSHAWTACRSNRPLTLSGSQVVLTGDGQGNYICRACNTALGSTSDLVRRLRSTTDKIETWRSLRRSYVDTSLLGRGVEELSETCGRGGRTRR